MSFLLRQSLSKAELDRMFEDDSTESFEALERRVKTPKKKAKALPAKSKMEEEEEKWLQDRKLSLLAKNGQSSQENQDIDSDLSRKIEVIQDSKEDELPRRRSILVKKSLSPKIDPETTENKAFKALKNEEIAPEEANEEEDDSLEEEHHEVSFLQRATSMMELSSSNNTPGEELPTPDPATPAEEQVDPKPLKLARSVSEADLTTCLSAAPKPVSEFLLSALEAHRQHLVEQDEIQRQMEALMRKARQRREEFRKAWGVSPKSINRKRTVKTVITEDLEVQFSPKGSGRVAHFHFAVL